MNKQLLAGLTIGMSVAFGTVALVAATPVNTDPTPVVVDQPAIVIPTDAPTAEPAPTTEPGDSEYVPSTEDCGPDAYRIEPGVCEQNEVEIGEAITVECDLENYFLDANGNCVDVEIGEAIYEEPLEDDPLFDCRIHGNHVCGVEIEGVWYVLNFDTNTFQER